MMRSSEEEEPPLRVFAAGSLREPLRKIAAAYRAEGGGRVEIAFGASGLMRERIEAGEPAELFCSADIWQPATLKPRFTLEAPEVFARCPVVVLGRPRPQAPSRALLDRLLEPGVKLGVSTPGCDPSGDYALAFFDRVERARPGAGRLLRERALPLTGGREPKPDYEGDSLYGWLLASGAADYFITYRATALQARRERPELTLWTPPRALAVTAAFAFAPLRGARPSAPRFARYILSAQGQEILEEAGFETAPDHPLRGQRGRG